MENRKNSILQNQMNYREAYFYLKSEVLYQMTFAFCDRFIARFGDRTRDQMIQAARSCKQNIVEGLENGMTSTEMMLKLINVARSSQSELREDYIDYLKAHSLTLWDKSHPRYNSCLTYCKGHNRLSDYQIYFNQWSDEEYCNTAISLCHYVDKMLKTLAEEIEAEFTKNGGIKERMHKVRTGYRAQQDEELAILKNENETLKREVMRLRNILDEKGISY